MESTQNYLDPQILARLRKGLKLPRRLIVEGYVSGVHRSPFHGFSIEFAEHREYAPGDDLRHLDWKVYGRTDKLYLKQFEEETNLACYLLLDTSGSMGYAGQTITKLEHARRLAASLAYLMIGQRDAVGLLTFDPDVRAMIPAHLRLGISGVCRYGNARWWVANGRFRKCWSAGDTGTPWLVVVVSAWV